jgi:hypothetical protein
VAVTLSCSAAVAVVALSTATTGDYVAAGPVAGDNAAPAVNALIHGDLAGLVGHQPSMGLVSIVLRAPLAGLAALLGSGHLGVYRMGALACLLPLALFAAWLVVRRRPRTVGWLPGVLAAIALLLSPALADAVQAGHPEGAFLGVLVSVAVIAAVSGRSDWAGVLLGLSLGTKGWGAIAVVPVLMAVPGKRVRTATIAGAVAAATTLAAPLADPAAFARAMHVEGFTHVVNAFSLWWPLGSPFHLTSGAPAPGHWLPLDLTRSTASILGLCVALPVLAVYWARTHRRGGACDPLALLALFGVLRCACDTTALEYYYLAALIPLAAWEVVGLGRTPVVTVLATAALTLIPGGWLHAEPAVLNAAWVALTFALVAYLARRAFNADLTRSTGSRRTPAWQLETSLGTGWER